MKRIYLNFEHQSTHSPTEPRMYTVDYESDTFLTVTTNYGHGVKSTMNLTKNADGTFQNEHRVRFVKVKPDMRKKPFSVESQEEGRGPKTVRKFATVEEIRTYVKGHWQGWEYYDGGNSFHSDYCTFTVKGVNLADLVPPREEFERDAFFSKMEELHGGTN